MLDANKQHYDQRLFCKRMTEVVIYHLIDVVTGDPLYNGFKNSPSKQILNLFITVFNCGG